MTHPSPLLPRFEEAGAAMIRFGPPEAPIDLAGAVAAVQIEYDAIREHAALLDLPTRATLTVTGDDRIDFLQRLLTQQLADLDAGRVVPAFFLNRKGRIAADVRLVHLADRTILETDAHAVDALRTALDGYLFSEDVQLGELPEPIHVIELHGPNAPAIVETALGAAAPDAGHAVDGAIGDASVVVARTDTLGVPGFVVLAPIEHAAALSDRLASGEPKNEERARLIGWYAANIARIESGRPSYFIDFGPDSLPGETGVLRDRVNFTKGCYVGQEVVARMDALGHPSRMLVGLRFDLASDGEPFQPITGAAVSAEDSDEAKAIGAVTSSTLSPMLEGTPICFAMVKHAHTHAGTDLFVEAEGSRRRAVVQESLRFVP